MSAQDAPTPTTPATLEGTQTFTWVVFIPEHNSVELRYEKEYQITFLEGNHTRHEVSVSSTGPHLFTMISHSSRPLFPQGTYVLLKTNS